MSSNLDHLQKDDFDQEIDSSLEPIGDLTAIAGYGAPPILLIREGGNTNSISDKSQQSALLKLAAKVVEDPLLQRKLSKRVYELMQEDLRHQKERIRNYRRRY